MLTLISVPPEGGKSILYFHKSLPSAFLPMWISVVVALNSRTLCAAAALCAASSIAFCSDDLESASSASSSLILCLRVSSGDWGMLPPFSRIDSNGWLPSSESPGMLPPFSRVAIVLSPTIENRGLTPRDLLRCGYCAGGVGSRECGTGFDPRQERLVQDDGTVEHLPAHDAGLVQRIRLIGAGQVVELWVFQQNLTVAVVADKDRREHGHAGCGCCRRGLCGADTGDDDGLVWC